MNINIHIDINMNIDIIPAHPPHMLGPPAEGLGGEHGVGLGWGDINIHIDININIAIHIIINMNFNNSIDCYTLLMPKFKEQIHILKIR